MVMEQSILREKYAEADKTFDDILSSMSLLENKKVLLRKAYMTIKQHFKNSEELRKSGDLSITHHLWVAKKLIDCGFSGEFDVILAALLHDLVEDTDFGLTPEQAKLPEKEKHSLQFGYLTKEYGENVSRLVDAVTEIRDLITNMPYADHPTYEKLRNVQKSHREAFYIKFADRWHNLSDSKSMPPEKMLTKAEQTDKYLVSLAQDIGSQLFYAKLGDLSFEILNRNEYDRLCNAHQKRLRLSQRSKSEIISKLRLVFQGDKGRLDTTLVNIRSQFWRFDCDELCPYLIRKETEEFQAKPYATERSAYPLLNIYLIFRETYALSDHEDSFDIDRAFISVYNKVLINDFTLVEIIHETRFSPRFYILQDVNGNFYKVIVMTKGEYTRYLYGDVENAKIPLLHIEKDGELEFIQVHKKDGAIMSVEKGSTVLDFAFNLFKDIGLYTKEALVNGTRCTRLEHLLSNGDHVEIISDYSRNTPLNPMEVRPYAELNWFLKVNTHKAKAALVSYFESVLIQ